MATAIEVSIWRGRADGRYQTFTVPLGESQTVLDIVTWVQRKLDPTLAYRFACRVGMCGSCAMTVNGRPRWTCRTHISKVLAAGRVEIGPLANMPIIKDLACDMAEFFAKWQRAKGTFAPGKSRRDPIERISPATARRMAADAAIECINCAVCYAACDTVRWNEDYLGPAALNRAWTLGRAGRGRRLPRLPFPPELPGALPQRAEPRQVHRRPQAAHVGGLCPR